MNKTFLIAGSLCGALAVALGAFGAHALRKTAPDSVGVFQMGVQYQMYHSLALLATAIIYEKYQGNLIKWAGHCFITGIILFSGSLYLLTFIKVQNTVGLSGIGMITPFGGLFFIAGWLFLLAGIIKKVN